MGVTRRAARLGFAALLLGAGAAAVAAHPAAWRSQPPVVVVPGDARLDLAWALEQGGMAAKDAMRMGVLLVDQVDIQEDELEPFILSWGAEIWWRTDGDAGADGAGGVQLHVVRARLRLPFGTALKQVADASGCAAPQVPFLAMRTAGGSALSLPPGTLVLIRLVDVWTSGGAPLLEENDFLPVSVGAPIAACETVVNDLQQGVWAPTGWPID